MTTASGISRRRIVLAVACLGARSQPHHVAGPGAQHVAADDGRELDGPDQARRQPRADGSWNAVPKRSQPCWNGSEIATMIRWPSISRYVR